MRPAPRRSALLWHGGPQEQWAADPAQQRGVRLHHLSGRRHQGPTRHGPGARGPRRRAQLARSAFAPACNRARRAHARWSSPAAARASTRGRATLTGALCRRRSLARSSWTLPLSTRPRSRRCDLRRFPVPAAPRSPRCCAGNAVRLPAALWPAAGRLPSRAAARRTRHVGAAAVVPCAARHDAAVRCRPAAVGPRRVLHAAADGHGAGAGCVAKAAVADRCRALTLLRSSRPLCPAQA